MLRPLALIAAILLVSCENREPSTPPDQTYTLRAIVTGLPDPPKQALRLHHEAIPDFIGQDGKVQGMEEMEMEFPFLSPAAKLDGIAFNDAIEATMEIRWKSKPRYLLTSIKKLPTGTQLNLGPISGPEK